VAVLQPYARVHGSTPSSDAFCQDGTSPHVPDRPPHAATGGPVFGMDRAYGPAIAAANPDAGAPTPVTWSYPASVASDESWSKVRTL